MLNSLRRRLAFSVFMPIFAVMERITQHIAALLHETGHVFIPGIGGFIACPLPPSVNGLDGSISPRPVAVSFDASLEGDDSILIKALMASSRLPFDAARIAVGCSSALMVERLNEGGEIVIEGLGKLSMDINGKIVFTKTEAFADTSIFGLGKLSLPYVPVQKKEPVAETSAPAPLQRRFRVKPTVWKYLEYGVACAMAFAIYLSFSEPIDGFSSHRAGNYASVFMPESILPVGDKDAEVEVVPETPPVVQSPEPEPVPPAAKPSVTPRGKSGQGSYCIIVASISPRRNPNPVIASLSKDGFDGAFVIKGGGRARICVESYTSKRKALARLREIRRMPKYSDAWILRR